MEGGGEGADHKFSQNLSNSISGMERRILYNLHFLVPFHNIKGDSDRCSSLKVFGLKKLSS